MLIVLSVTPWSVAPVAWPLPHGEGSVPNVVVEPDDDAPDAVGATTTPAVVNIASTSPNPSARLPRNLIMAQPPVCGTGGGMAIRHRSLTAGTLPIRQPRARGARRHFSPLQHEVLGGLRVLHVLGDPGRLLFG